MALLVSKVPFWEGASKGVLTICDTQKQYSAEDTIFIVFSAERRCAEINRRNRNLPKIGGSLPTCEKVFFFCFWCFRVLFVLCFCSFL